MAQSQHQPQNMLNDLKQHLEDAGALQQYKAHWDEHYGRMFRQSLIKPPLNPPFTHDFHALAQELDANLYLLSQLVKPERDNISQSIIGTISILRADVTAPLPENPKTHYLPPAERVQQVNRAIGFLTEAWTPTYLSLQHQTNYCRSPEEQLFVKQTLVPHIQDLLSELRAEMKGIGKEFGSFNAEPALPATPSTQVKTGRGFRLEPHEMEASLAEHMGKGVVVTHDKFRQRAAEQQNAVGRQ